MQGALVIIDAEGRNVGGNMRALEILGVSLDQLRASTRATFASAPADPVALHTVGDVLAAWRAAEQRLEALEPGSPEWDATQDEVAWLRDRHATVFRQRAQG